MKPFTIEFEIKGISLDVHDMSKINEYYEAACTGEYIYENYKVSAKRAMKLGYDVRRYMNKYDSSESDAIYEISKIEHLSPREIT